MVGRERPAARTHENGFTLIELLVVMIIIGILASIAIPVFLSQRKKAADTATKSDVSRLAKEVAAYYVDGTVTVYATYVAGTPGSVNLGTTSGGTDISTLRLSDGTTGIGTSGAAAVSYLATTDTGCTSVGLSGRWYLALTNTKGSGARYYYSAAQGLSTSAPVSC